MPEFGVEELGLLAVHVGPGAGRRVQPADKVVDALRALTQVHLRLYCIFIKWQRLARYQEGKKHVSISKKILRGLSNYFSGV